MLLELRARGTGVVEEAALNQGGTKGLADVGAGTGVVEEAALNQGGTKGLADVGARVAVVQLGPCKTSFKGSGGFWQAKSCVKQPNEKWCALLHFMERPDIIQPRGRVEKAAEGNSNEAGLAEDNSRPRKMDVYTAGSISDRLITYANANKRQAIASGGCQDVTEHVDDLHIASYEIDPDFVFGRNERNLEEPGLTKEPCAHEETSLTGARTRRELLTGTLLSGLAMTVSFQTRKTLAAVAPVPAGMKEASPDGVSAPASVEKPSGSRIYDASVLGEPFAVGKDKGRVWQKVLAARVVYLGESERVPDPDDKVLELEIVKTIRDKCFEQKRPVSLALEAVPCTLQPQLNAYMSKRLSDKQLRALVPHWSDERWKEYLPLLQYCRNNGVRLMAGGTPLEVLRTVQAKGVQGLKDADRRKYVPPMGTGIGVNTASMVQQLSLYDVLPNASTPFGPGPYRFAQARVVEDHTMSQVVLQGMADGGSVGILLVVVGATHVLFGSKGTGVPARISKNLQKRTQAVILLNPERQRIRKEGELPEADFLWYSAAKECSRNCFDRAEIARVMDAAGRRRDALPKDLQAGLDLGLVPPEVLKDFFDLDKQPFIAELTKHFQGLRERWLADPRFLQRLGIEEAISITTTLIAQYERRKGRFFQELDYVITDTVRGAVVDFFTVWLPAPTLSFRSSDTQAHASGVLEGLKGLLGSLPDNAFQRPTANAKWDLQARLLGVVVSGMKLFSVGFIASIGTVAFTNTVLGIRQRLKPNKLQKRQNKRSPILKTAFVYSCFLGTSANLRYQAIAGVVEHWIADFYLASNPLAGNVLSFVARTANSYWGTQQWVDLARFTGLQAHKDTPPAITEKSRKESPHHGMFQQETTWYKQPHRTKTKKMLKI
ncbi:hypothetical protein GOP47_0015777 [Adiantum capillus-veneris]|uniref:Haem-binding uptake Tiki superfamily ChaN domain-containing protein n=1 Tax=Adiantum capillus-veneris TaxID=13818 RepID=A0A9D4ZEA5_ADICA|nr:hypothetical protein GOP47_0015777 [Adiantum capillus-veneris]